MKKHGWVIFYRPAKYHFNAGRGLLALDGKIFTTRHEAKKFNRVIGISGEVIKVKTK